MRRLQFDLGFGLLLSCNKQKPHPDRGENSRTSNATYTERVGEIWLNMACGMVSQRLLLTARADSVLLTRNRSCVQHKLVEELCLWSDVGVSVALVYDGKSLGLSDAELGF
jgi:hypothetical protein